MELSAQLLKSFAKVVNQPSKETSKTLTIYGDLKNDKNDFTLRSMGQRNISLHILLLMDKLEIE